jgi:hypothetical protein
MIICSLELASLFPDRDISTITNEEIEEKRKEYYKNITTQKNSSDFQTYKTVGIVLDEYGNEIAGIVEETGLK